MPLIWQDDILKNCDIIVIKKKFSQVASEENPIKNEPEDSLADDYENTSLSLSEDFEDAKDDESDSFSLKIAEEPNPCEESPNPEKYKEVNKEIEQVSSVP